MNSRYNLDQHGYAWLRSIFNADDLIQFRTDVAGMLTHPAMHDSLIQDRSSTPTGARNLLTHWPAVVDWVRQSSIVETLHQLLGNDVGCVRALYFDKPPGGGWALPWHRDQCIAVAEHRSIGTFRKPTTKAGVPHVEAPDWLLKQMLAVRIHLDPMRRENGALLVQPGSHHVGDSSQSDGVMLTCEAGDVLLMQPLLLHSSASCDVATTLHRRVIHLEFAPSLKLPEGYRWRWFAPLARRGETLPVC